MQKTFAVASGQDEIRPDCLYPLPEFKRRTGLGTHAMRTARRNGLLVRRVGGRAFILGKDFIEHLEETGGME